jgi:hypothetical protein
MLKDGGQDLAWRAERRRLPMVLSPEGQGLRDRFLRILLETTRSLQPGEDLEVTLEALVEASQMLTEHLQRELTEVRQEQVD